MNDKAKILDALRSFAAQRPGLEFGNYGDRTAYLGEMRSITKDLHHARELLRAVDLSSITGDELAAAFKHAYSGRLTATPVATRETACRLCPTVSHYTLEYCTGQYFPTEYRKAVCAVAAAALWEHFREDYSKPSTNHASPGDRLRAHFRGMFGRSIAARWFN